MVFVYQRTADNAQAAITRQSACTKYKFTFYVINTKLELLVTYLKKTNNFFIGGLLVLK